MRTKRKIVPSFSADAISFHFPLSWKEMSQEALRMVLDVMAAAPDRQCARVKCLLKYNHVHVIRRWDKGWLCFCWMTWRKKMFFVLKPWQLQWMTEQLEWMDDFSSMQNRLEHAAGGTAVDMVLHGVPFGDYLQMEKWYQLYLHTKNDAFIEKIGHCLYLKNEQPTTQGFTDGERFGVLLWWVYVKEVFARAFPKFFRRADGELKEDDFRESIVQQMNIQIRALTEGDVTKESLILDSIDCWRALTELNEKAREAQEVERMRNKNK